MYTYESPKSGGGAKQFKKFLSLLTAHVSEVEAIAARAERDVKVESAIKNFEEVWLSKLFDLTEYQRSYPTTRAEVCTIILS